MTTSNRVAARILLVTIGALFVAASLLLLARTEVVAALSATTIAATAWSALDEAAVLAEGSAAIAGAAAAVALVAAALLVGFALSRGRGRTSTALVLPAETGGSDRVELSVAAVRDIVRHVADDARAVEKVDVHAYRVSRRALARSGFEAHAGGGAALLMTGTVRRGADPRDAHRELSAIVERLDQALDVLVPVVIELVPTRHRVARAA